MKRNNKFMALAMAGALAVSNFGALAIPMTAFAATTTGIAVSDGDQAPAEEEFKNGYAATTKTLTITETGNEGDNDAITYSVKKTVSQVAKDFGGLTITAGDKTKGSQGNNATQKYNVLIPEGLEAATYIITFEDAAATTTKSCEYTITVKDDRTNEIAILDPDVEYSKNMAITDFDGAYTFEINKAADIKEKKLEIGVIDRSGSNGPTFAKSENTLYGSTTADAYIKWESSDETVLSVDPGTHGNQIIGATTDTIDTFIKPEGTGSATVTATAYYKAGDGKYEKGKSATLNVNVVAYPNSIDITRNEKSVTGTTIKFDSKTTSVDLEADVTNSTFSNTQKKAFELTGRIGWVSADKKLITVSGANKKATVTPAGNTTNPTEVTAYLIDEDDPTAVGTVAAVVRFTSEGQDVKLVPNVEKTTLYVEDKEEITASVNSELDAAEKAAIDGIVYTFKSSDESIVSVTKSTTKGVFDKAVIEGKKSGVAKVVITGEYLVENSATKQTTPATVTGEIVVTVLNKDGSLDDAAAADKITKAEEAQKKAEADAATQKAAADKATKEAAAQKDAATKAATAQKAAEEKAADLEKQLEEAKKNISTTGIKKGAIKAVKGQTFKATSSKYVTLTKIKNAKIVTVGSTVEINDQVYKVTALGKGALKAGKATKLTVDAQYLTKKGINADCAKGTGKIKTLVIKNQTKKAAPAKAVKKYNKKVKVQYK